MLQGARPPRRAAFRIALIYFLIGAAWILFSDTLLARVFPDDFVRRYRLHIIKGWTYIGVTAALLYFLIRRTFTAVRASADAKRESDRRTRLMVDRVRDYAIFSLDKRGKITSWNRGAQQITDWSEDDVIGKDFAIVYTKADADAGKPAQHIAEATDLGWSEGEGQRVRKDGSRFRAAMQLTGVKDDAGAITGFLCVLRDVTEKRRQQEAVQHAHQMLASIIETSPLPIIMLDAATNVLAWNPAAVRMFQWTVPEVLGKPLPIVPDAEREGFQQLLREQSGGKRIVDREIIRKRKDGSLVQVSLWTAPLLDSGGNLSGVVGIFVDLSERRLAEEKVRQLNETLEKRVAERTARLEEANEELQAFSYTVSHDLRIPLRSMQQLARELMTAQSDRLDEEGQSGLTRIVGAAARMEANIEELLDYSRSSRTDLDTEPVSIVVLVHETIGRLKRDPAFTAEIHVREPLGCVRAHRMTLQRVILNLLMNATTFVRPGIKPDVHISATDEGETIRLFVEDNGIGINDADRERIFHVFERLPAAESYPGIGVGLTVARRGVERMGGTITFQPSPTGGTVFCIELPKARPL